MPEPAADARLPDATPAPSDATTADAAIDVGSVAADAAPLTTDELAAHLSLRDVVLRAYPDVVVELVQGETLADLLGCVPTAQAAWQRVVAQVGVGVGAVDATLNPADADADADAALLAAATPTLPSLAVSAPLLPGAAGGSVVRSAQPGLEQMTPLARIRAGLRG